MLRKLGIVVLLLFLLLLTACDKEGMEGSETQSEDNIAEAAVTLIKNGITEYTVIRPDIADEYEVEAAMKLRQALMAATGGEVAIDSDWDGKDEDNSARKEILIGETNRPQSAAAIEAITSENGYSVTVVDNYIVIAAKKSVSLDDAVKAFISEVIGYDDKGEVKPATEVSVMMNLNITGERDMTKHVTIVVPDSGADYANALIASVEKVTNKLKIASWNDDPKKIYDVDETDLVIVCNARNVPVGTLTAVDQYMKEGGDIITLGGPTFENTLYNLNGAWMQRDEYMAGLANTLSAELLIDTTDDKILKKFTRSTNNSQDAQTITLVDDGREDSNTPAIQVDIENLTSWDLFGYNIKIAAGNNAIAFWGKGSDRTDSLYVEVHEKDGSRWYATPAMTENWQYYVLTSADFVYWDGNGRGGSGDKVSIDNLQRISFGLARSGQPAIELGAHTFWVDDVATMKFKSLTSDAQPVIDGMSPQYKLYQITNAADITAHSNQVFVSNANYMIGEEIFSVAPGRQGVGFSNMRKNRFIPILEVTDAKGLHSGYAAWMYVFESMGDFDEQHRGAMLASFGVNDADFYNADAIKAITDTLQFMLRDAILVEGGTDEFIYITSETEAVSYGAIAAAKETAGTEVKVALYKGDKLLAEITSALESAEAVQTHDETSLLQIKGEYAPEEKPDRAVTELLMNGEVIDRIEHEVSFWEPKPESERKFVYTENGSYMRDGERINLFGINYMPSSGMANEAGQLFEHYVSAASYDPEVFYNDLLHVKDIGFNAISIFYYVQTAEDSNNMLHLVQMCEDLGLLVDLSIRPYCYPFSPSYSKASIETLITKLHFHENDTIVAYDIAWESTIGTYEGGSFTAGGQMRKDLDDDWREWINVQYGSIEAAEAAWGVEAPRANGEVIGATDAMLSESAGSKYTAIVAAYRRFIDDVVASRFRETADFIKTLAPDQLVSFRMQTAGSADSDPAQYHYDFHSLASSLDFMSPEAYALSIWSDNVRQGVFANLYARLAQPDSAVVWKEFGMHVWSGSNIYQSEKSLGYQAEFYRQVYEMCLEGYTAATYCWYYTPGYRVGENSDYGVLNPDGSDRPVTAVIREYAEKFANIGEMKAPDYFIAVDREEHPDTIRGMYYEIKKELENALDNGHTVALTNEAIGKTVDEVFDLAVGGASTDNGVYPRKYVNGYVSNLRVNGDYITDGTTVTVKDQTEITLDVTNSAYAAWKDGQIKLVAQGTDFELALGAFDYLDTKEVTFTLTEKGTYSFRFSYNGTLFGNDYTIVIK